MPWRLSTSQLPQTQCGPAQNPWKEAHGTIRQEDRWYSPSGGFGPVAEDGYGVSYMVCGENRLYFHVSSKNQCAQTDSKRFQGALRQALLDMRDIFDAKGECSGSGGGKKDN